MLYQPIRLPFSLVQERIVIATFVEYKVKTGNILGSIQICLKITIDILPKIIKIYEGHR